MKADIARGTEVLVVGAGSMLGRALLSQPQEGISLTGISHETFAETDLSKYDVIVNMAYDARYMRQTYDEAMDFDLKVAQAAAHAGRRFVMMSTRRIYGTAKTFVLAEDGPKNPLDFYGRNKLETEGKVQALLGQNCAILRLSNVFDFEPSRHTFFGIALTTLQREGRIVLDANPLVKKDFIPLSVCAAVILTVLSKMPSGVFNVGYGTATEIGCIATWIIEGYGRGELVVTSDEMRDEFLLDIGKLTELIGAPPHRASIRERCLEIGERLRNA